MTTKSEIIIDKDFYGWNHGPERVALHMRSVLHVTRLLRVHANEETRVGIIAELSHATREEQAQNQQFLRLVFLTMREISGQGLALRGKDEFSSNFINMLENMMKGMGKNFQLYKNKILLACDAK